MGVIVTLGIVFGDIGPILSVVPHIPILIKRKDFVSYAASSKNHNPYILLHSALSLQRYHILPLLSYNLKEGKYCITILKRLLKTLS